MSSVKGGKHTGVPKGRNETKLLSISKGFDQTGVGSAASQFNGNAAWK